MTPHRGDVWPITRTVRGIPTELRLDESDGMPQECAASLDNIRPVRRSLLVERMTRLSARRVDEACLALRLAVDC